ncbi:uncharacterized protein JCM6883_001371 [Sporobolomyces salmoneus]|uniref:uncharacterized protein n=1 Tax=Sporobolomyces salmoneus TaxID=183962 RepID=UPI00317E0A1B
MPAQKRSPSSSSSPPPSKPSPAKKAKVSATPAKKSKVEVDEGADVLGKGIWKDWPAPRDQLELAKSFIFEAVKDKHRILLCPDKDADGLSSCLVLHRALTEHLSHPPHLIQIYFLPKGINIHAPEAQEQMLAIRFPRDGSTKEEEEDSSAYSGPTRAIIMDQGSRPGPALLPPDKCSTLLIDHHQSSEFPDSISVLSACKSEPVATTSILAYLLCCELVPSLKEDRETSMGALLGLYGDLGASKINLSDPSLPWPTWLAQWEKTLTKTKLSKATALLNAPRRTPEFNAKIAWEALNGCKGELKGIMEDRALGEAKERTSNETTRWQGAAPKFSKDGQVAVIRVESGYQIHPVIATRWQGTLRKAKTLVCIMCANSGYTPGKVNFSCRAPRRSKDDPAYTGPPDLIGFLRGCIPLCEELSPGWGDRVGHDFARGHKEATGGIIPTEEFEVLMQALEIGVKAEKKEGSSPAKKVKGVIDPNQKTTLDGFFGIKPKKEKKVDEGGE